MDDLYENIKQQIHEGATRREKSSTFHFLVLLHADELKNEHPSEFLKAVGMPKSYKTEFKKMLNLAIKLKEQGFKITEILSAA